MPRAQKPLVFPPPTAGFLANAPPYQMPINALVGGQNMLMDNDGLLHVRGGYERVGATAPDIKPLGGLAWVDESGNTQAVVGTRDKWWALVNGDWADVTDLAHPLNNTFDECQRMTLFFEGGAYYAYGVCNGPTGTDLTDPVIRWKPGDAAYTQVTAAPGAADICTLANRVVICNTSAPGPTRLPQTVRWSAINDGQTWAASNNAILPGNLGNLVAVVPTSRLNAVVYAERGAWIMQASPGTDAEAFSFERLLGVTIGPVSASAVVEVGGVHYYVGVDGRVYMFDGQSAQAISGAIDHAIIAQLNFAEIRRSHAVYLPQQQQVWFFVPMNTDSDPQHAIVLDLRLNVFMPPAQFSEGISCSLAVRDQLGVTWDNWVSATATWDDIPYNSWSDIPSIDILTSYLGTAAGPMVRFPSGTNDSGAAIVYIAALPLVRADPRQQMFVSNFELYIPITHHVEMLDIALYGVQQPWDASGAPPITLFIAHVNTNLTESFVQNLSDEIGEGTSLGVNWLQLTLAGASTMGGITYGGASLYVSLEQRPDDR